VAQARMRPPFLAKPLWADGRDGAHGLAVIHDEAGLAQLVGGRGPRGFCLPVMLQQYVEHGGCLFKARRPPALVCSSGSVQDVVMGGSCAMGWIAVLVQLLLLRSSRAVIQAVLCTFACLHAAGRCWARARSYADAARAPAALEGAAGRERGARAGAQIFVMGPIVVLVRRPSLRIPVDPEDVTQEVGAVQMIARISSFASEMPCDVTLKGDPPQWVVQARARMAPAVAGGCRARVGGKSSARVLWMGGCSGRRIDRDAEQPCTAGQKAATRQPLHDGDCMYDLRL